MKASIYRLGLSLFCAAILHASDSKLDSALFPELESHSAESIKLHGIAQLYPGRILFEDPSLQPKSRRTAAAKIETIADTVKYVRVYRLKEAENLLREASAHPELIIDLRYMQSEASGLAALASVFRSGDFIFPQAIGETSKKIQEDIDAENISDIKERTTPVVVLCNQKTAGPFEAVLDSLQDEGSIIALGLATAGHTGFYEDNGSGAWILKGEFALSSTRSLIGVGFQPRLLVQLTPEQSYLEYNLYEAGTPIDLTINQSAPSEHESKADDSDQASAPLQDTILKRAIEVVAALQVLHKIPNS